MNHYVSAYRQLRWKRPARALDLAPESMAVTSGLRSAVEAVGEPTIAGTALQQVIAMLCAAAEVEHQLMVQYLYALYSLGPLAPPAWTLTLRGIAHEEMGHLLTVQNLLLLLGQPPHLARLTPELAEKDPFPFQLEPFSKGALAKYVTAESPLPESLPSAVLAQAQPAFDEAAAAGLTVTHVGVLYAKITWLFQRSGTESGPWEVSPAGFTENVHLPDDTVFDRDSLPFQGDPDQWGVGATPAEGFFVMRCADRASALVALHAIAEQGEGLTPNDPSVSSHFERFLDLYATVRAQLAAGQALPVRPVPVDPTYGAAPLDDPAREVARIEDPITQKWAELSDHHYHMLLGVIGLTLRISDQNADPGLRGDLVDHAVSVQMRQAVLGIGKELVARPRKAGTPVQTLAAALPFSNPERPAEDTAAAWRIFLRDKSARSDALIALLLATGGGGVNLLNRLTDANAKLRLLADRVPDF